MRSSFSLFKKKTGNGLMWYVRFWNEKANDYTIFRSTGILVEGKRERRKEAEQFHKNFFRQDCRYESIKCNATK